MISTMKIFEIKKIVCKKRKKKDTRVKNNNSFDPIILRAVERVVGGHLEGFDHKTVRK